MPLAGRITINPTDRYPVNTTIFTIRMFKTNSVWLSINSHSSLARDPVALMIRNTKLTLLVANFYIKFFIKKKNCTLKWDEPAASKHEEIEQKRDG